MKINRLLSVHTRNETMYPMTPELSIFKYRFCVIHIIHLNYIDYKYWSGSMFFYLIGKNWQNESTQHYRPDIFFRLRLKGDGQKYGNDVVPGVTSVFYIAVGSGV